MEKSYRWIQNCYIGVYNCIGEYKTAIPAKYLWSIISMEANAKRSSQALWPMPVFENIFINNIGDRKLNMLIKAA